jgi:hypothetical protein
MSEARSIIIPRIIRGTQYLEMAGSAVLASRLIPGEVLADQVLEVTNGVRALVVGNGTDVSVFLVVPNRPHLSAALFQAAVVLAEGVRSGQD